MVRVLLQFIPLALAAVAPAMIAAVILMLGAKGGLFKSLAFVLGRVVIYTLWGLLFLALASRLSDTGSGEASTASLAVKTILGGLLLILAVKIHLGEDDPDAPPPKWMTALEMASSGAMFGIGALLSIVQIRFVLLMLAGATIISDAHLPVVQTTIALIVLVLAVIWVQLLPIVLYVVMGNRAQDMLDLLNDWLARNQRMVNVVVLGLFGIVLLGQGLTGLLSLPARPASVDSLRPRAGAAEEVCCALAHRVLRVKRTSGMCAPSLSVVQWPCATREATEPPSRRTV